MKIEFGISKGTWFYICSFAQIGDDGNCESGISIIIFGLRVSLLDNPGNWNRREWVIPRSAWHGHVEGW